MATNRDKLLEMLDDGVLDASTLAKDLLVWLSDDDCAEFAHANDIPLEDEDEDEDEDEEYEFTDEDEVNEAFANHWAERCREVPAYKTVKPAKRMAFTCFVDDLQRKGRISDDLANDVTLQGDD